MKYTHAATSFWIIFVFVLVIFSYKAVGQNQSGKATYRTCIESSGEHTDPRTGAGPECEKYGYVTESESKVRSALRGLGEGFIPALLAGGIAFYIGSKIDDRESKHTKDTNNKSV